MITLGDFLWVLILIMFTSLMLRASEMWLRTVWMLNMLVSQASSFRLEEVPVSVHNVIFQKALLSLV
jgi:hypothetical protein